jgi:hypothetical protein
MADRCVSFILACKFQWKFNLNWKYKVSEKCELGNLYQLNKISFVYGDIYSLFILGLI